MFLLAGNSGSVVLGLDLLVLIGVNVYSGLATEFWWFSAVGFGRGWRARLCRDGWSRRRAGAGATFGCGNTERPARRKANQAFADYRDAVADGRYEDAGTALERLETLLGRLEGER
ncbi:MAG: hypothetical protein ACOC7V_07565 [Spirochaetota bacterium]